MEHTLKVTGNAVVHADPDTVILSMTVEGFDKTYDLALKKGRRQLQQVNEIFMSQGFPADALKTSDFLVSSDYVRNADAHGRFKNDFNGYFCRYRVRLEMNLDMKKVQSVLASIQNLLDAPRASVDFTVKNTETFKDLALQKAVADAFHQAEIIASASRVDLGEILSIEYADTENTFLSSTHYLPTENGKSPGKKHFHPEQLLIRAEVSITWSIHSSCS